MQSRSLLYSRIRTVVFLLFLLLLLAPAFSARPVAGRRQAPQQRPARPFPPAQYVPSHDYDTREIVLDLHFDWDKEQAIGVETFSFSPLINDLRRIVLDAAYMTFASVKLSNGTSLQYQFDDKKEKLSIMLDRAYQPKDSVTVIISYRTNQPSRERRSVNGGGGLTWIKPTPEDAKRPRQIWSQGESEYNHYWFACFDHPNDFFTSEVYATVEKPLSVISNGKLLTTKENADGTRTFHWKIASPHASYLSSIVVGEYVAVVGDYAGTPVITYVYPNEVEEGKVTAKRLPEMVKFFSEKTGLKYPYEKYAQTVARDFNGGMENISATTQYDLMIHDARTEVDRTEDSLQSHELAHQWFGDYVTCRNWSDIWLNESFATYFQAMWDEHSLGHDDFLYLDVKGNQDAYYNTWAQGNRRPIVTKNYANPDAVFDTYAYPRGGAVLHMLRQSLGEESWWRAINYYLNKYAHQPVETEQFRIAIEESTGQSMDWFFDEWVYKMGHPVFRVTQDYDPATKSLKLSVKQEQKRDPDSQYPQVGFFQTPVDIEIGTATNTRVERVQIDPKEEQTFTFPVDSQPLLVNFDYGDTLIKELRFEKTTAELVYQLAHDQDVIGRVWALGQLSAKIKDKATADSDKQPLVGGIAAALTGDKFWGVRLEAATALNNTPGDSVRTALLAATKDPKSRVRARAIRSLVSTKDATLAGVYEQFLNDPSYAVIGEAARALGQTKSPTAYDALVKLVDTPSWRDNIRASALAGLAAAGDKRAMELGFRYVAVGNPTPVRASALGILGATGKDDARAFTLISDMLEKGVESRNFGLIGAAAGALVELGDQRGLALFEEMGKKLGDNPQVRGFILQFQQRLRAKLNPPSSPQ